MIEAGTLIGGDFRVIQLLGEGGMGAVYVAEQTSTASRRALKVMAPGLLRNEEMRLRFVNEAKATSQIASDHVVQVVAAGVDPSSHIPWLAMELLEGESLGQCVRRSGPMHPAKVMEVVSQLCHALDAAHRVGIVHRDLKPDNVFLAEARREGVPFTVKVLDFGIAKLLQDTDSAMTAALGTPLWMAPEQTTLGASVSPATDVWAVGLLVFWMLTGATYWRSARTQPASLPSLMREVVLDPIEPASVRSAGLGASRIFSPAMDAWFATCLDRDPGRRFPTAKMCRDALIRALSPQVQGHLAAYPQPASAVQPAPFAPQSHGSLGGVRQATRLPHVLIAGCSTVVVAVLVASLVAVVFVRRARSARKGLAPNAGVVTPVKPNTPTTAAPLDFDRARFDPHAFLPRANELARAHRSDARLVQMCVSALGVGAKSVDLIGAGPVGKRYVAYSYRSDEAPPNRCSFTVFVSDVTAQVTNESGTDLCRWAPVTPPRCSVFQVVDKSIKSGLDPRIEPGISYQMVDGKASWSVFRGGFNRIFPDDCR